jgi:hypothetical protein
MISAHHCDNHERIESVSNVGYRLMKAYFSGLEQRAVFACGSCPRSFHFKITPKIVPMSAGLMTYGFAQSDTIPDES